MIREERIQLIPHLIFSGFILQKTIFGLLICCNTEKSDTFIGLFQQHILMGFTGCYFYRIKKVEKDECDV